VTSDCHQSIFPATDNNSAWSWDKTINIMKHVFTFLVFFGLIMTAQAQNTKLLYIKTIYPDGSVFDSTLNSFNANDQLELSTRQYYSTKSAAWLKSWQNTYTYDGNGDVETKVTKTHGGADWKNWEKSSYTYKQPGTLAMESVESWVDNAWIVTREITHHYDPDKLGDTTLIVKVDAAGNKSLDQRIFLIYDAKFRLSQTLEQKWDEGVSDYKSTAKQTYLYNSKDELETEERYSWISGSWYFSDFFTYTMTSFGEIAKRVRTISATNVVNDTRYYFYNKEDNTAIGDVSGLALIRVYPNPIQDRFFIDFGLGQYDLEVTNMSGQVVENLTSVSGVVSVDAGLWERGMYLYKIMGNQNGVNRVGKLLLY